MRYFKILIFVAFSFLTFSSFADSTAKLKEKLNQAIEKGQTYFGHHDDPVYGHAWVDDEGRSDVLETSGKYPGIMSWDLGKLEWGDDKNLDGVSFERMRKEVALQDKRGGLNTFSWHPENPITRKNSWDTADKTIVSQMVNTEEGKVAYVAQLDYLADFFNSLRNENGDKIGVIFRPWHEHTGSWFWWGADNCSVEDYIGLWKIMRQRFDEKGVDNVIWAYSPDRCLDVERYMSRYPGDEYVDIFGTDVYHFNDEAGREEYIENALTALSIASQEAEKRGKLFAFTETGLESLPISDWFTSTLLPILQEKKPVYVVVWRNAHNKPEHFYAPYSGHPAEETFKEFSQNPQILFIENSK